MCQTKCCADSIAATQSSIEFKHSIAASKQQSLTYLTIINHDFLKPTTMHDLFRQACNKKVAAYNLIYTSSLIDISLKIKLLF